MKILVGRNSTPLELSLFPDGCCYEIKNVVFSYDLTGLVPGTEVAYSDLTPVKSSQLVIEDTNGNEWWYDPTEFYVVPFEVELYQAAIKTPAKYHLSFNQAGEAFIDLNPNWEEPAIVVAGNQPSSPNPTGGVTPEELAFLASSGLLTPAYLESLETQNENHDNHGHHNGGH